MPKPDPNIAAHLEWIGFVRPTGLVVSAPALDRAGAILDRRDVEGQRLLRECAEERRFAAREEPQPWLPDFRAFASSVVGWSFSPIGYAGTDEAPIPAELEAVLPDSGAILRPDFAMRTEPLRSAADAPPWQLLVQVCEPGGDFDRAARAGDGLEASPHGRMERLLRHTGVPAGLLFNGLALRLLSAPRGESSGWLDFRVADRVQTAGRPIRERVEPPLVPDGTIYRVLEKLLVLDGERISYRALDVEHIGSVYETMMGFRLETATGRSAAIRAAKRHGAPATVDAEALLREAPASRAKWIQDRTDRKLTERVRQAVRDAGTAEALHAALDPVIDKDATPDLGPAGAMVLQPSEERRRSGSHYTPRELTEPIVREALEPIFGRLRTEQGGTPHHERILDLKICDPAMGSGAFLVEACRQLADALSEAWRGHDAVPEIPADENEIVYARRQVAQRCLYGVDRNPVAVDLAKLSLWLITLAKDHPLTFLDHALRHGDSLVGLSRRQIEAFHWQGDAPQFQGGFEVMRIREHLAKIAALRERIRESGEEVSDQERRLWWRDARDELNEAGVYGDLVLAAEVFERDNPGFDTIVGNPPFAGKNTVAAANVAGYPDWLKQVHAGSHGNADQVAHFFRRAFDLVRLGGAFGLIATNTIAQGDTHSTGLRWICTHGGEIYQARRRVPWPGLAAMVVSVLHVHRGPFSGAKRLDDAVRDRITAFLFHRGGHDDPERLEANAGKSFQGSIVLGMGFTFDDTDKKGVATPLAEMRRLIEANPLNREAIFPYIGGEEVNTSPTHANHRYVINFRDWPLRREDLGESWAGSDDDQRRDWLRRGIVPLDYPEPVAADWPDLLGIVEARARGRRASHSTAPWWQFERLRPELFVATSELDRVLAISRVGQQAALTFLPAGMVYAESTIVFPFSDHAAFCVLQSRPHETWARFLASSMKDDLRYTPSDCFETFPFPEAWETCTDLESAGETCYAFRADLMVRNGEGLTKTYNRFHDPHDNVSEIVTFRSLHAAMDRAVLDAYGWRDIPTACEFRLDYEIDEEEWGAKKKPYRYRWPDEVRDEVLARLLELNAERAAQEDRAGKAATMGQEKGRRSSRRAFPRGSRASRAAEPRTLWQASND